MIQSKVYDSGSKRESGVREKWQILLIVYDSDIANCPFLLFFNST